MNRSTAVTITDADRRVYWPTQTDLVVSRAALERVLALACAVGPRTEAESLALLAMADVVAGPPRAEGAPLVHIFGDLAGYIRDTVELMRTEWEVSTDGSPNS